ncbi:unnamed protein product [Polarella glacialis]|uniref:Uncharacterized protein n=1 Tax=Polarella glacialis TaxID=89957 RepID=A0A813FLX9_POLGL|nr:unnamed protein product [Polarella glacialis]CAE8673969.1 unnamed protein product [Polarella glacialis]
MSLFLLHCADQPTARLHPVCKTLIHHLPVCSTESVQSAQMGRSAKMVRTPAFEKQKRQDKGQDWKVSHWKEARAEEKKEKVEQRKQGGKGGKGKGKAEDRQHNEALSEKMKQAVQYFDLASAAAGVASMDIDTEDKSAGGAAADKPKKKAKAKAKAKA